MGARGARSPLRVCLSVHRFQVVEPGHNARPQVCGLGRLPSAKDGERAHDVEGQRAAPHSVEPHRLPPRVTRAVRAVPAPAGLSGRCEAATLPDARLRVGALRVLHTVAEADRATPSASASAARGRALARLAVHADVFRLYPYVVRALRVMKPAPSRHAVTSAALGALHVRDGVEHKPGGHRRTGRVRSASAIALAMLGSSGSTS